MYNFLNFFHRYKENNLKRGKKKMSKKIKIVSNPYKREIKYYDFNNINNKWEDIIMNNPNSRLRETESEKSFFPFKIKDIIDIIIEEYYIKDSKIEIFF